MRSLIALLIAVQALAETAVSPPRIGPAVGDQSRIRMAVAGDRIFAAWADTRGSRRFDDFTIYASPIDADGRFLTPQGILVSEGTEPLSHDVVAIGDRFVVVWITDEGVYARAYDSDGRALAPPRLLMAMFRADKPVRAAAAVAGSRILVTTSDYLRPLLLLDEDLHVVAEITTPMEQVAIASDGSAFLAVVDTFFGSTMRIDTDGRVTRLETGPQHPRIPGPKRLIWTGHDYVLVSSENKYPYQAYAARISRDGRRLSERTLSTEVTIEADVDVASPGDGSALVAWTEYPYDIHVAPLAAPASRRPFAHESAGTERFPAIVWTGSRYLLAWTDDFEITIAFADRDGRRVAEGVGGLTSVTEQRFGVPARGVASDWIAWQEDDGVTSRVWFANALRVGGTTIARGAFDRGGAQTIPRLATSGDQLLAVWTQNKQVLARRFTMQGDAIDADPLVIAYASKEIHDISATWDGRGYLVAYAADRSVWLARLFRFGPARAPVLLIPASNRIPSHVAIASGGEGSLVAVVDRPQPCSLPCDPVLPELVAVLIDRNGELTDPRIRTIARTVLTSQYPSSADVVWSDGIWIVAWQAAGIGADDAVHAARVDVGGTIQSIPTVIARAGTRNTFTPSITTTSTGIAVASSEWQNKLVVTRLTSLLRPTATTKRPHTEYNGTLVTRSNGEVALLVAHTDATLGVTRLFVTEVEE